MRKTTIISCFTAILLGVLADVKAQNVTTEVNADYTIHNLKAGYVFTNYDYTLFRNGSNAYIGGLLYKKGNSFQMYGLDGDFTVYSKDRPLTLGSSNGSRVAINPTAGNVGIGTLSPSYLLDVAGPANLNKGKYGIALRVNNAEALWFNGTYFSWGYGGSYNYFADAVGIGTTKVSGYMLSVEGKVRAREINVNTYVWSDYVFKPDYKLRSLKEVDNYIKENGHLPNIPTTEEVTANGVDLGEMQVKLLEKVEELTLYMINLENKVESLEKNNTELQQELNKLR